MTKDALLTELFLNWSHIDRGGWQMTFDPNRLSDDGRRIMEQDTRDWNWHYDFSGHGMKPENVPYGVRVTVEPARKSQPWLVPDRPWEDPNLGWGTVIHENGRYRCWYEFVLSKNVKLVRQGELATTDGNHMLAYAESTDGLHWTKPSLGLCELNGSRDNNVVTAMSGGSPFRDDNAPPEQRYKAFDFTRLPDAPESLSGPAKIGLMGMVSPDGIHWKHLEKPLFRYFHDTQNIGCWDPLLKKYVAYLRGHTSGRAIKYSVSDDFAAWPEPLDLFSPDAEDEPSEDYYNNCFTFYPDLPTHQLFFISVYNHSSDTTYVRLAANMNRHWKSPVFNWVSRAPILPVGKAEEWDSGMVYAGPNLVHLPDGQLALPYWGSRHTHNEYHWMYYGANCAREKAALAWALWDDGRLAGFEAGTMGEFVTGLWGAGVAFEGSQIEINARTRRIGQVEVELLEVKQGQPTQPIPGFTLAECVPFRGDEIWAPLCWKGKRDLSELKGRTLKLHFRLRHAKVFGFRFV